MRNNNLRTGGVAKSPTGIKGLDEITLGGLPTGRPTLICGSAGCGKTLFGMKFLVRGVQFGEAGVCVTFEARVEDVIANVAALGFDLPTLIAAKKLSLDRVELDRTMIEETGEYDLEGLFVRLGYAIDALGAKRVLLDTIEALFAGLSNTAILRCRPPRLQASTPYMRSVGIATRLRRSGSSTSALPWGRGGRQTPR